MSKLPETGPSLIRKLRQAQRQALRQAQSSAFSRSGTSVTAEGVTTVDGELDVTGTLNVTGNTVIGGTLSLPAGIIDNAALTSPVIVGSNAAEFGVSTAINIGTNPASPTTLKTLSVTVPAAVTNAIAFTSAVSNYGTTGATSTVITESVLNVSGAFSYAGDQVTVSNDAIQHPCTLTKSIVLPAVTPGATITLTATAFATASGVYAEGDASLAILFLR